MNETLYYMPRCEDVRAREFRLPSGAITKDINHWADSWNKLGNFIQEEFGYAPIGYDPGVLVGYGNKSMSLPTEFVIQIFEKIKGEKWHD